MVGLGGVMRQGETMMAMGSSSDSRLRMENGGVGKRGK